MLLKKTENGWKINKHNDKVNNNEYFKIEYNDQQLIFTFENTSSDYSQFIRIIYIKYKPIKIIFNNINWFLKQDLLKFSDNMNEIFVCDNNQCIYPVKQCKYNTSDKLCCIVLYTRGNDHHATLLRNDQDGSYTFKYIGDTTFDYNCYFNFDNFNVNGIPRNITFNMQQSWKCGSSINMDKLQKLFGDPSPIKSILFYVIFDSQCEKVKDYGCMVSERYKMCECTAERYNNLKKKN